MNPDAQNLSVNAQSKLKLDERWSLPLRLALFLALGGAIWWLANDFSVAEPEGFDPLRYEYFARNGLPQAFADSSSFRMVLFLEYLYKYLPFYAGYLIVIGIMCYAIILVDKSRMLHFAISCPISFYYLSQTGKDGIAILALISGAILAINMKNVTAMIVGGLIIALSFFVRPAIGLLLPIVFVQYRFGTFWATALVPFMLYAFSIVADTYQVLGQLEGLTGDEGAGQMAALLRQYTFGYDRIAVFYKIVLLLGSFVFQPVLGIVKYLSGSSTFVLFEGLCFAAFLFILVKEKLIIRFIVSSIPYVLIIGATSPFYHFRYLAVTYPLIYAFCIWNRGIGWSKPRWRDSSALVHQNPHGSK